MTQYLQARLAASRALPCPRGALAMLILDLRAKADQLAMLAHALPGDVETERATDEAGDCLTGVLDALGRVAEIMDQPLPSAEELRWQSICAANDAQDGDDL